MGYWIQHVLRRSRRADSVGWLVFVLLVMVLVGAMVHGVAALHAA